MAGNGGVEVWLAVLNDLHQRGVQDVLVCCVDGLAGFPEAIEAVFPAAWVQTCIVHQIRNSMRYVTWKDRKQMIADSWHAKWQNIIPFLALPADLRRAVYTTNSIENLNRQIRKTIKTRGASPDKHAATKLIYLAITRAQGAWKKPYNRTAALRDLKIHFRDRLPD